MGARYTSSMRNISLQTARDTVPLHLYLARIRGRTAARGRGLRSKMHPRCLRSHLDISRISYSRFGGVSVCHLALHVSC